MQVGCWRRSGKLEEHLTAASQHACRKTTRSSDVQPGSAAPVAVSCAREASTRAAKSEWKARTARPTSSRSDSLASGCLDTAAVTKGQQLRQPAWRERRRPCAHSSHTDVSWGPHKRSTSRRHMRRQLRPLRALARHGRRSCVNRTCSGHSADPDTVAHLESTCTACASASARISAWMSCAGCAPGASVARTDTVLLQLTVPTGASSTLLWCPVALVMLWSSGWASGQPSASTAVQHAL
jgi:hypothetical protein